MAKAKSKEAGPATHIPAYNCLNVREPELFARLFAAAKKRKLPKMSLTAMFRFVAAEWLEYQEDDKPKRMRARKPKDETPTMPA